MWEVTLEKGLLVKEGKDIKSAALKDKLAFGALVEEQAKEGERMNYKLLKGAGPDEGWVSISAGGKTFMVEKEEEIPADHGGPGGAGTVEIDADLKAKIEADAKLKQEEDALLLYVPKYKVFGYPIPDVKFRIVCFHNAGSAESQYSGPGTPFVTWAKEKKNVEILAIDLPGRDKLIKAKKFTSAVAVVPDLMATLYHKLTDGVPYAVWGHSMGTWVCFEFLQLARKIGAPMPIAAFLNAFPAPHLPWADRPWPRSKKQSDAELKETLTNWDKDHFTGAGKVVFDQPGWDATWAPLMKADFQLYDEYKFTHKDSPKFDFPIHAWHMKKEHFNKKEMIEMWKDWTTAKFDTCEMEDMGHLTCFYKPDLKKKYFAKIVACLKELSP
mmetsp:Transcript_28196/g.58615  ORF Transcript_28196/g.58615 Transcript_28196/m.58615 type:complete len:384 (+) Transcript_28196:63-1214(+)